MSSQDVLLLKNMKKADNEKEKQCIICGKIAKRLLYSQLSGIFSPYCLEHYDEAVKNYRIERYFAK